MTRPQLGLPDSRYPVQDEGWRRPNTLRDCFVAAFDHTPKSDGKYREFRLIRETLPSEVTENLLSMPGDDWRRSDLYTRLGYGIDQEGGVISAGADLAWLRKDLREQMRRLIDWSFYCGVHKALELPTRFPGKGPPSAFYELLLPSTVGLNQIQGEDERHKALFPRVFPFPQVCSPNPSSC
jgi:hypothetical protein